VLHQLQPSGQQSCRDRNSAGDELWRLNLRGDKDLDDLAHMWNPVLRGWINYYGKFYKSVLSPVFCHLDRTLTW
jgi:Group II intron, maturase-specific domain